MSSRKRVRSHERTHRAGRGVRSPEKTDRMGRKVNRSPQRIHRAGRRAGSEVVRVQTGQGIVKAREGS